MFLTGDPVEAYLRIVGNRILDVNPNQQQFEFIFNEENTRRMCSICYDDITYEDGCHLICGHPFHKTCIKQWFEIRKKCPYCNSTLTS